MTSTVSVAAAQQQQQLNISLTSSLTPTSNSSWTSPSGLYAFGFYKKANGYAVGIFLARIRERTVLWTAVRDNPPFPENATLLFNSDSKLVLRSGQEQDIYIANPTDTPTSASMLDLGNFVLYDSVGRVIWQSFDFPTDTILPGQRLLASTEQQLFSGVSETDKSKGIFRLQMQADGNLVQYPVVNPVTSWHVSAPDSTWYAYWSSGTYTYGNNVTLNFDQDGRLYLLNATTNIRDITDGGYPTKDRVHLIRLDPDGIFRLYMHNLTDDTASWSILWNSTNDKCAPKGTCGINSFCFTNDQEAKCQCLPGFAPVSEGNQTSGCERNFTSESCKNNGPGSSVDYSMQEVTSTIWEDTYFSSLSSVTKDECKEACLEDCNCEAVLYTNGVCRKQRLPLRFGARSLGNSNTVLIKVGSSTSGATSEPGNETKKGILESKHDKKRQVIIVSSVAGVLIFVLGLILYILNKKSLCRQVYNSGGSNTENQKEDLELPLFDFLMIAAAANNFSEENKLGEGGFGPVYKGVLKDGQEIAVKKLSSSSNQGISEFKNEVTCIAKLQHRNLVKLLGYCIQEEKMLLYEYMPNKSLDFFIFDQTQRKLLNWNMRFNIINGIARGLLYLHQDSRLRVIHRDLKASNVLLDHEMNPKISDFGTARSFGGNETQAITDKVVGTYGYMSPEYAIDGNFSTKSDVFSYGVLLLEIVAGQKNRGFYHPDHSLNLLGHAWKLFNEGRTLELIDELIDGSCNLSEALRSIHVGLLCVQRSPEERPSMSYAVMLLTSDITLPQPKEPGFFNERELFPQNEPLLSIQSLFEDDKMTMTVLSAR